MPLFRNRVAALLPLLALVFQGLLPLAAQAQASQPDFLGAICSVDNARGAAPEGGLPAGQAGQHDGHCALCAAGADRAAALVPSQSPVIFLAAAPAAVPAPRPAADTSSTVFPPAQPRAPPAA